MHMLGVQLCVLPSPKEKKYYEVLTHPLSQHVILFGKNVILEVLK